jgi:hypothetical protein
MIMREFFPTVKTLRRSRQDRCEGEVRREDSLLASFFNMLALATKAIKNLLKSP